jgi:hypothetical protein
LFFDEKVMLKAKKSDENLPHINTHTHTHTYRLHALLLLLLLLLLHTVEQKR